MGARALVVLVLGTLFGGAACRSEQVAERWQRIEREREGGEQPAPLRHSEQSRLDSQASLLLGAMERQIARSANLEPAMATRRAAEVELMEIRPKLLAQLAERPDEQRAGTEDELDEASALAAIDVRRMEIRRELEREPFVSEDDWPAYVARLRAMTQGLRSDVQALGRRSARAVVSTLEPVAAERAI